MRTSAGFRVELHRKAVQPRVFQSFATSVVRVPKTLSCHRISMLCQAEAFRNNCIVVVLARDPGPCPVGNRLVCTMVSVLELHGLPAHGECCELVAQADSEDRYLSDQFPDLFDLKPVLLRVYGPVGDHNPVRLH